MFKAENSRTCASCFSSIPLPVKAGVAVAVALAILAVVGHFALHWGNMPTIAVGSASGGMILTTLVAWAIYSCKSRSTPYTPKHKPTPTPKNSTVDSNETGYVQRTGHASSQSSPSEVAQKIYNAMASNHTEDFTSLITSNKKILEQVLSETVEDKVRLYDATKVYTLSLGGLIKRTSQDAFLGILLKHTDAQSFFQRPEFQAYELVRLMIDYSKKEFFIQKMKSYSSKELASILSRQVFIKKDAPEIYKRIDNPWNLQKEENLTGNEGGVHLFDIALALYEKDKAYYSTIIQKIATVDTRDCSRSLLLAFLPDGEIVGFLKKLENGLGSKQFRELLSEDAIKQGKVVWFTCLYDKQRLFYYQSTLLSAKELSAESKMKIIKAIPPQDLEAADFFGETILHRVIAAQSADEVFFKQFLQYCQTNCVGLLTKPNKNKQTPLAFVHSQKGFQGRETEFAKKEEIVLQFVQQ